VAVGPEPLVVWINGALAAVHGARQEVD